MRGSAGAIVGGVTLSDSERRRRRKAVREALACGLPLPVSVLPTHDEQRSDYAETVNRWMFRLLAGRCSHSEFDDIIGRENDELCAKLDSTMVKYPDPRAYALTRTYGQRAVLDWRRRERVQRCEGAEIEFDEFGRRTKGNTVDSFDMPVAGTDGSDTITLHDLFAAEALDIDASIEDLVVDGIDRAALVASILDAARVLLSPGEQRAIELVVSQGLQVVEAAAEAGVARETMGRQRDRAVAALRNAFGTLR